MNPIAAGRSVEVDTAEAGENLRCDLRMRFFTGTSLDEDNSFTSIMITNLTFVNFFPPEVMVLSPNGGELFNLVDPFPISWKGSDRNSEEILRYSVEISPNAGYDWKIVGNDVTDNKIFVDPTDYELKQTNEYLVRVNVSDGHWLASDTSDNVWGFIPTPGGPPPWELIFIPAVIEIIVLSTILVILMHRRFSRRQKFYK